MKKLFVIVLSLFLITACNRESTTTTTISRVDDNNVVKPGMINNIATINTVNGTEYRNVVDVVERDAALSKNNDVYYIEIENMPCMILFISSSRNGITCDWDYWTGKRNADYEADYESSRRQPTPNRKVSRAELRMQNEQ